MPPEDATAGPDYTRRLLASRASWWKRLLPVQAPFRANLRRMRLGRTLEVGCGIGRCLAALDPDSIGVDHNPTAIAHARRAGLTAYLPAEFAAAEHARPGAFDALLFAHVIEHLSEPAAVDLVGRYLPYLREHGRVVWICPQERGYPTDPTHVRFCGFPQLRELAERTGLAVLGESSFPLPRRFGAWFRYNEFVVVAGRVRSAP